MSSNWILCMYLYVELSRPCFPGVFPGSREISGSLPSHLRDIPNPENPSGRSRDQALVETGVYYEHGAREQYGGFSYIGTHNSLKSSTGTSSNPLNYFRELDSRRTTHRLILSIYILRDCSNELSVLMLRCESFFWCLLSHGCLSIKES